MKSFFGFILTLLLCVIFHQNSMAQKVAGYLGKRTFIGATVNYIPNVFCLGNPASAIDYKNKSKFYMLNPVRYGISAGFAVKNYKSIVIDLDYQRMGLFDNTASEITNYYGNLDFLYARGTMLNLKVKMQKALQHCAPIGAYSGMTFGMQRYNNSYFNTKNEVFDFKPVYDASIGFNGGVRRVFKDKFMLDLGVDFNLHLRLIGSVLLPEENIEEIAKRYSIRKNGYNNILSCRAALYYLL